MVNISPPGTAPGDMVDWGQLVITIGVFTGAGINETAFGSEFSGFHAIVSGRLDAELGLHSTLMSDQ